MKLTTSSQKGFTLVELMIVVAIIGLLLAIAVPNFMKSRELAQSNTCKSNLRVIETAKQMWGMEVGKNDDDIPVQDDLVGLGLYIRKMPKCPAGGTYDFLSIGESPECDLGGVHVLD